MTAACEDWAAALQYPAMPSTDAARKLAAAFQNKFIRDIAR